jgi:hypothetical protein
VKTFGLSLAIGTAITLALFGLGYVAAEAQAEVLSYTLYWQAYVLQMLVPCSISINRGEFLCENMIVAKVLFFSGIPLGIVVYSAFAYLALTLLRRRRAA